MDCSALSERNRFIVSGSAAAVVTTGLVAAIPSILVALGVIKVLGLILSASIVAGIISQRWVQKKVTPLPPPPHAKRECDPPKPIDIPVKPIEVPAPVTKSNPPPPRIIFDVIDAEVPMEKPDSSKAAIDKAVADVASALTRIEAEVQAKKVNQNSLPPSDTAAKPVFVEKLPDQTPSTSEKTSPQIVVNAILSPTNALDKREPLPDGSTTGPVAFAAPVSVSPDSIFEEVTDSDMDGDPDVISKEEIEPSPPPPPPPLKVVSPVNKSDEIDRKHRDANKMTFEGWMKDFSATSPRFKSFKESLFTVHGLAITAFMPQIEAYFSSKFAKYEDAVACNDGGYVLYTNNITAKVLPLLNSLEPNKKEENSFSPSLKEDSDIVLVDLDAVKLTASMKKDATIRFCKERETGIVAFTNFFFRVISQYAIIKVDATLGFKQVQFNPKTRVVTVIPNIDAETLVSIVHTERTHVQAVLKPGCSFEYRKDGDNNILTTNNLFLQVKTKLIYGEDPLSAEEIEANRKKGDDTTTKPKELELDDSFAAKEVRINFATDEVSFTRGGVESKGGSTWSYADIKASTAALAKEALVVFAANAMRLHPAMPKFLSFNGTASTFTLKVK